MAIIDSDKETRKRTLLDPEPYRQAAAKLAPLSTQGALSPAALAGQQPQAPVAAPQPVQAQPVAPASIAPPVPAQAPQQAATQAATQAEAYNRAGIPQPGQPVDMGMTRPAGQSQADFLQDLTAASAPLPPGTTPADLAPPAITPEARKAEYERVDKIQIAAVEKGRADRAAETDRMRVRQGLKPLTPQAPAAAAEPLPTSVIAPETDPELAKEAMSDPVISGLETRLGALQRRVDAAGGKSSPQVAKRIADLLKQGADRLTIVQGTVQAKREKADKDIADKIAKATEAAKWASEARARSEASGARSAESAKSAKAEKVRKRASAQLLGAAQDAAKDGRYDDADKMAEAGQTNAADAAEANAFNAIRKEVQTAKDKEAKKKADETLRLAKRDMDEAQKALDTTLKALAKIRDDKLKYEPTTEINEREGYLTLLERQQRPEMEETRAEYDRLMAGDTRAPETQAQQIPPPEQRANGQVYQLPNGKSGRWNAQAGGWEIVE